MNRKNYQRKTHLLASLLCRSKNRTVVEYALKSATVPMGVATYKISNELPEEMKKLLPGPEEIARRLEEIDG